MQASGSQARSAARGLEEECSAADRCTSAAAAANHLGSWRPPGLGKGALAGAALRSMVSNSDRGGHT